MSIFEFLQYWRIENWPNRRATFRPSIFDLSRSLSHTHTPTHTNTQEADKKVLNVSLYILGEYDTLIDLTYDGAKRLRDNKASSDLNLLHQNDPCPPPDRWACDTGWSKCNPSSVYAKDPPANFDWVRYSDTLRLRTEEYKVGFRGYKGVSPSKMAATGKKEASSIGADKLPGTITDTQTAETTAAVSSTESDLSEDERHRVGGRLTRVTRAGWSAAGANSHSRATSDNLSASARPARSSSGRGAKSHFQNPVSDNLSASARPARSSSGSTVAGIINY